MKKIIYFLGWLFNIKQWASHTIRNLGYLVVALGVYVFTDNTSYTLLIFSSFILFELMVMGILVSKWEQYNREQNKVFNDLQK